MQFKLMSALALCGLTAAVALPSEAVSPIGIGYFETAPWTKEGFLLPKAGPNGVWRHVVNETAGLVTSTYLGDPYVDESANEAREAMASSDLAKRAPPPWPTRESVATCYNQHYIADHVTIAQQELGNWCQNHRLEENTNYSFVYIDVVVFVCSWAQTITNDCSAGQLSSALGQCSATCGANFGCTFKL